MSSPVIYVCRASLIAFQNFKLSDNNATTKYISAALRAKPELGVMQKKIGCVPSAGHKLTYVHKAVQLGALVDDSVTPAASVYDSVCSYFDIVSDFCPEGLQQWPKLQSRWQN